MKKLDDRDGAIDSMAEEDVARMDQKTLNQIAYDNMYDYLNSCTDAEIIEYSEEWGMDISEYVFNEGDEYEEAPDLNGFPTLEKNTTPTPWLKFFGSPEKLLNMKLTEKEEEEFYAYISKHIVNTNKHE